MYFINPNLYVIISPPGEKCGLARILNISSIEYNTQLIIHAFALDCTNSKTMNDSFGGRFFMNPANDVFVDFGKVFGTGI